MRHKSVNTPLSQDGGRGTHVTHFVQLYPQPLYTVSQVRTTCCSWDEGVLTDLCLTGVLIDLCLTGVLTNLCLTWVLTDLCITGALTDLCLTGVLTDLCLTGVNRLMPHRGVNRLMPHRGVNRLMPHPVIPMSPIQLIFIFNVCHP